MIKEYQLIMENDVQDAVLRPEGNFVVSSMWIYKIKHVADDNIRNYKARFVLSLIKEGVDYGEMCSTDQTQFSSKVEY